MHNSSNSPTYLKTLAEVESFILQTGPTDSDFNALALRLFHYQLGNNPGYSNFCKALDIHQINCWQEVPTLTTDVFKCQPPPSCLTANLVQSTFMTSGTTGEERGQHHFRNTQLYDLSILTAWQQLGLPQPTNLFILTPPPEQTPHSSLSHMMETLRQTHCPEACYLINNGKLDPAPLLQALTSDQPISLLGTALAFLNLFETLPAPIQLPAGSWAMETGGYKGSGRTLSKVELYAEFEKMLRISSEQIWNEYSMTELSSQFYTRGIGRAHHAPHWMKVQVLDPETDQAVAPGEMGYLVIHDLANIDSVSALRTQDLAIYHDSHSFTLVGRDPSALPRGCSRSIDEALNQ
ncbi:MAG: hypothetical protein ABGY95_10390 [Rubritalea sp.]|uniref:LuxE/PaaK family acyltransferase n=1 Tax=Rubritalea sp. TaxID=2109375 RepID=UPI0032424FBE